MKPIETASFASTFMLTQQWGTQIKNSVGTGKLEMCFEVYTRRSLQRNEEWSVCCIQRYIDTGRRDDPLPQPGGADNSEDIAHHQRIPHASHESSRSSELSRKREKL
jgi:hypothetical protein